MLEVARRRWWLAVLVVAVAAAATIYSLAAPKRYEATARVVVHPVQAGDTTYSGIDVLRESPDAGRVLATAAQYFVAPEILSAAAQRLNTSAGSLEDSLDVHGLSGSNVLLIVGRSSHAGRAAEIANTVLQQGIAQRTAEFQAQLTAVLSRLRASSSPDAQRRVVDLEALQGRPDPTLEQLSAASVPAHAAWPKPGLLIPVATLAALGFALFVLLVPVLLAARPVRAFLAQQQAGLLERRSRELALQSAAVAQREREIAEREHTLARRLRQLEEASRRPGIDQAELERRLQAVSARESAVARQVALLAARERELEQAKPQPALPSAEPGRVARPEAPAGEPPPPLTLPGRWSVEELERRVAAHAGEHPERADEWRFYLGFLREHQRGDGKLPASFDLLILDVFSELIDDGKR